MANRYWVGGNATWDNTADSKWSTTSGGTGGASVPTASDDVFFDANSGDVSVAIGTIFNTAVCNNVDFTGFIGTANSNSTQNRFQVNGNITLSPTMNATGLHISIIGTGTLTTNGRAIQRLSVINASASLTLSDNLETILISGGSVDGQVIISAGALDTGNYNINCKTFTIVDSIDVTVTLGSSEITCQEFNGLGDDLTLNEGTSNIIFERIIKTNKLYNAELSGTYSSPVDIEIEEINNLTLNTTQNSKLVRIRTNMDITGTLTADGVLNNNMVIYTSDSTENSIVHGPTFTITNANPTLSNVSFYNITAVGTWAGTRLGDLGGNTSITFDTPVNRYWVGNSGNYSDNAKWSTTSGGAGGASMPLPQDTAIFDQNSITSQSTITIDILSIGKLDFGDVTEDVTIESTFSSIVGLLVSGNIITTANQTAASNFANRVKNITKQLSIEAPALDMGRLYVAAPLTVLSDIKVDGIYLFSDLTATNVTIETTWYITNNELDNSNNTDIDLTGSTIVDITNGASFLLRIVGSLLTIWNPPETIKIMSTPASSIILRAPSLLDIEIISGKEVLLLAGLNPDTSARNITITGDNATLFFAGTTQTDNPTQINNIITPVPNTNITIRSADGIAEITKPTGEIIVKNATIQSITALGGATYRAPINYGNVDGGNNTNWNFSTFSQTFNSNVENQIQVDQSGKMQAGKKANGVLSMSGMLERFIGSVIQPSISIVSLLNRNITQTLQAHIESTATLIRSINETLNASLEIFTQSIAGTIQSVVLQAELQVQATMTRIQVFLQEIITTLEINISKRLHIDISVPSSIEIHVQSLLESLQSVFINAEIAVAAKTQKTISKIDQALYSTIIAVQKTVGKIIDAFLEILTQSKQPRLAYVIIDTALTIEGIAEIVRQKLITTELHIHVDMEELLGKTIRAFITVRPRVRDYFFKVKYPKQNSDYWKKY